MTSEPSSQTSDDIQTAIVSQEEACLDKVKHHAEQHSRRRSVRREIDYDRQLLELRDEIGVARMEDVPPLLEQMERLQMLANRQRKQQEGTIDVRSPYFGRMVLEENQRRREVLIGRSTYVDSNSGVRIVDWRDAPVSRLYYRYAEGDHYEEVFGDREIEGRVTTRRSLTIVESRLRRIVSPQGTFLRPENGEWRRADVHAHLGGGQGTATRPEQHHAPKKLGIGLDGAEDKHLREITALIDPQQFELITRPDSGLVVIQGGAGSGKTTIGLHRLAYLAYQDRRRFRPDRMLVVVFNQALARYIGQVLPSLDVHGVQVRTYEDWASRLRTRAFPELPARYSDETPNVVTRLKKHPVMLQLIDDHVSRLATELEQRVERAAGPDWWPSLRGTWHSRQEAPLVHRIHRAKTTLGELGTSCPRAIHHAVERECDLALERASDVVSAWAELLTDHSALLTAGSAEIEPFSLRELERAYEWCKVRCLQTLTHVEQLSEQASLGKVSGPRSAPRGAEPAAEADDSRTAVDGRDEWEDLAELDREDDTLLLRFHQRLRGPLLRPSGQEAIVYEHILIDEAQDLSPVELSVVMNTLSPAKSVTFAGDVAQRLLMNNGFTGWSDTLRELGLGHVQVEPLRVSYRSTTEIVDFSRDVLGALAPAEPATATRTGAPVQLFRFADTGDAVGFLAEALRELTHTEPRASVAVIARYPEQAEMYYRGLMKAELAYLRRIADQDFPFKPGIDVTDVKQVKGLEFDYVVLVEVTQSTYGTDEAARHLLHIAATRAAHQLWLLSSGIPSNALPEELRARSL